MATPNIAIFVGLALVLLATWTLLHPVHQYRFRMTIEVEKDGLTRTGSSVIELRTRKLPFLSRLTEAPLWETRIKGEAVFVDLGDGDHVIAPLLGSNDEVKTASLPSRAILGDEAANAGGPGVLDTLSTLHPGKLREAVGRRYRLKDEQMPPLIRFRRLDEPQSVEKVELASGKTGPMIKGWIEITDDKVTQTIRQHLPWLEPGEADRSLSGRRGRTFDAGEELYSRPNHFSQGNFIRHGGI
jgi:hypothetical protein